MDNKLFVGNIAGGTTEEDLNDIFAQAGTVTSVKLIKIKEMRNPKNIAFVEMGDQGDAQKAISMFNGSELKGRTLRVNIARPREALPAEGGWYTDPLPPAKTKKSNPKRKPSK